MDTIQGKETPQKNVQQNKQVPPPNNKFLLPGIILFISLLMILFILIVPSDQKKSNFNLFSFIEQAQQSATKSLQIPAIPKATVIPSRSKLVSKPAPLLSLKPSNSPIPTRGASPTPNPFIGWVTYRNSKYNYKIMCPSDWIVRDKGAIDPKIPNLIIFNPKTASASAQSITAIVTTRTYEEQIAIDGMGFPVIIAKVPGIRQNIKDSDGQQTTSILIPRTNYLLILRSKAAFAATLDKMLTSLSF